MKLTKKRIFFVVTTFAIGVFTLIINLDKTTKDNYLKNETKKVAQVINNKKVKENIEAKESKDEKNPKENKEVLSSSKEKDNLEFKNNQELQSNQELKDNQAKQIQKNTQEKESQVELPEKVNILSVEKIDNTKINYKNKIQIDGNVSEDLKNLLNDELNKVPKSILNKYFNIGGRIILTSHDIATTYYNDYVIGSLMELYDDRQKILYVSARAKAIKQGAIHGIAHAFDSMMGWSSCKTDGFVNIFNKEKNTIKTVDGGSYHKTSEKEYFAEAFYSFIINPSVTRNTAPQTVSFFETLISKI